MYIWIGVKLPRDFENEVRTHCLALNEKIELDTTAFLLPQHISLKISFDTDRTDAVLEDLKTFVSEQNPFAVRLQSAQQMGNILWLPVADNDHLRHLHESLDARLESNFDIAQHKFDKEFLFHSTLFMDPDMEKVAKMAEVLANYPIERELTVDTFLLGVSEQGKPGTYRVVSEIQI